MGQIKNQAIKNSLVSYLGASIGFINFILLLPYVFSPEQIGLTRLLQNSASLIVPFAELGIISVVLRYYPIYKADTNQKFSFIYSCLGTAFIGFFIFSCSYVLLKKELSLLFIEKSPLVLEYYYYIIPLVFFIAFTGILEAISNSLYKTVFPNFLREVLLRVAVSVLAILFVMNAIDFDEFIRAFVWTYCFPFILLILYLYRLKEISINFKFISIPMATLKDMATYGIFVLLGSTGHLLVSYIDTIMLGAFVGLEETGIYVTAFYMAVVIEIPRRSIRQIVVPHIADAWGQENTQKINDIYSKTSINQLIIGSLIFLGIWVNIDSIFQLMPNGEAYSAGKFVVLYILISKLIDMGAGVNGEIIALSPQYRFNMYSILILAGLAIVTNLIFIPLMGINGAALATVISLFLYNFVKYIFIKTRFQLDPFNLNTLKVLIIGGSCLLFINFIPEIYNPYWSIFIKSLIITLTFTTPIYFLKVSEDANNLVDSFFKTLKKLI